MTEARRRLATISALGIVQIFAWGSSYYLPAVLSQPIAADTGWPLALVSGGISLALLGSGLLAPRIGRLIADRGGRDVLIGGLAMLAAGLVVLAMASSLPVYALGWLAIGAGMSATLYDAAFSTLGRYYGYGARGAITTLTLYGGFASTVCWPLSAFLLDHGGWRTVCLVYAAIHAGLCIPLIWRVLPPVAPASGVAPAAGAAPPVERAAAGSSERHAFVLLAIVVTTGGTIATILSVHLISILGAQGASLAAAVALGALIGPSQVGSRLFDMAIGRRFPAVVTLALATALIAAGIAALAAGFPAASLALVLYGAGNGIWSIARGAVPLALFGPERFPAMMGRLAMPTLLAQSVAPPASALLIETAGTQVVLVILAVAAAANLGFALLLRGALDRRPRRAPAS